MLLENKSKLCFSAELNLVFDDETTKTLSVNVGDIIRIAFKHNGVRLDEQGKVTNIYPSRIVESQLYGSKKLSAVLELDCSSEFKSYRYKIDICDILDILPTTISPETAGDFGVWNDLREIAESNN